MYRSHNRFGLTRRNLIAASAGAAAWGLTGRVPPAHAQVESQLSMMGWADYISPDNISAWEKSNNSKLVYDNYASNDEMYLIAMVNASALAFCPIARSC